MESGGTVGSTKPFREKGMVEQVADFIGFYLVGSVVNHSAEDVAISVCREKAVALDEEPLERAWFRRGRGNGFWISEFGLRGGIVFQVAAVADFPGVHGGGHFRVPIGEVEEFPSDLHGEGLVAIEGKEPDTGVSLIIEDVGA